MFGISEPTGSHLPLLERALAASHGLVIEHGAGLYSTPLFARLGKPVLCCESQAGWREWAQWMYGERGEVTDSIDAVIARLPSAALVFIDGPSNERAKLIEACLRVGVPLIVAHDTAPRVWREYGWTPEHFAAPGYTVTHDDDRAKYRTTLWTKQLGVPFDP